MSDGKTIILTRIREALRDNPAPRPHTAHPSLTEEGKEALAAHGITGEHAQREWLPKVGRTLEEQISLFEKNSEELKTEFHRCASLEVAREIFSNLASKENLRKIATHTTPETSALLAGIDAKIVTTNEGYDIADLESCDAGVTCCDCLVAQTGGVLVSGPSAGGRALSVLPPHHIVIARSSQMLPDLTAAFELVKQRYGNKYPSFLSFITGPSRTGDIERILVLGAHGPKRLSVILVEE